MNQPAIHTPISKTRILAVGGCPRDLSMLGCLFMGSSWELFTCGSLAEARQRLHEDAYPVVICQSELTDGDWKDLLRMTDLMEHPPSVLVIARQPDEALWAEALNSGAFGVLAGSANPRNVFRTLSNAWRNWKNRQPEWAM